MLYQFSKGTALCTQNKQDNYKLIKYDDGHQNKKCRSSHDFRINSNITNLTHI